jgi:hypothetical protein
MEQDADEERMIFSYDYPSVPPVRAFVSADSVSAVSVIGTLSSVQNKSKS